MWDWLVLVLVISAAAGSASSFDGELSVSLQKESVRYFPAGLSGLGKDILFAKRQKRAGKTPRPGNSARKKNRKTNNGDPSAEWRKTFEVAEGKGCFHRTWQIPGACTPLADCGSTMLEVEKGVQPQLCGDATLEDEVCCAPSELMCFSTGLSDYTPYGMCTCVDLLNSMLFAPRNSSVNTGAARTSVARAKCREYSRFSCSDPKWYRYGEDVNLRMIDNCRFPEGSVITHFKTFKPEGTGYDKVTSVSPSGGTPVQFPDEFPHMALLGYGAAGSITFHCGGSLISPDFILTAAHCGSVQWAFLGTVNRSFDINQPFLSGYGDRVFPELIQVQDVIPHPDYNPKEQYNDIALLRLQRPATMTRTARPACLHLDKEVPDDVVAAGWGHTSDTSELPSEVLIKVNLKTRPLHDCDYAVDDRRLKRGLVEESHLCAGGEGIRDTCPGDSGGPLMVRKLDSDTYCMFSILGVVSFGPQNCGEGFPSVYTPVAPYVPWIESVVWPDEASPPRTTSAQSSAPPASGLREGLIFSESQNYASWL